jgi:hypothetical protein
MMSEETNAPQPTAMPMKTARPNRSRQAYAAAAAKNPVTTIHRKAGTVSQKDDVLYAHTIVPKNAARDATVRKIEVTRTWRRVY